MTGPDVPDDPAGGEAGDSPAGGPSNRRRIGQRMTWRGGRRIGERPAADHPEPEPTDEVAGSTSPVDGAAEGSRADDEALAGDRTAPDGDEAGPPAAPPAVDSETSTTAPSTAASPTRAHHPADVTPPGPPTTAVTPPTTQPDRPPATGVPAPTPRADRPSTTGAPSRTTQPDHPADVTSTGPPTTAVTPPTPGPESPLEPTEAAAAPEEQTEATVAAAADRSSEPPPAPAPTEAPAPRLGPVRFRLERRVRLVSVLAVVLALLLVAAGAIAFLQVLDARDELVDRADPGLPAGASDRLDATTVRLLLILAVAALVVAAIAAFVYRLMHRSVQAPLQQLSRDAHAIAAGELDHPVEPVGPVELQELALAMEQMRQRIVDELAAVTGARDALERQTGDLARSNAELEQFAYVASHDLQEPLRKVASFCQLLQSRYGGQLDDRADQYIAFAVDGAKRMQALINDLLALSRVGRTPADAVVVRAGQLIDVALENLSDDIEATDARITVVGPLPRVRVETSLGVALFQNLVSNALKFRRPGVAPSVHVSARRSAGFHEFTVRDEGIGIAPEYAERIFVIFQRLHARDDFGGTGIGLALCRKIVEGHGGRIWVDTGGQAGQRADGASGTTIRFTLPVVEGDA